MAKITVWSKQHENVWKVLQETGRYTVKREYIIKDPQRTFGAGSGLLMNGWSRTDRTTGTNRGCGISGMGILQAGATMLPEKGRVILELEIEESLITRVNFTKWGMTSTIPIFRQTRRMKSGTKTSGSLWSQRHAGVYVAFYPEIKREIRESWKRLFDDDIQIGSDGCYGNIWEVQREWVKNVIQ